jgi:hypothetical protein
MKAEPTDEVGQEVAGRDRSEPSNATRTEDGEAAGIPAPSYSPFESVPAETSLYQRFLDALGLTAADLERRFAQEFDQLSPAEQQELKGLAAGEPVQLTDAQQTVLHRMLTRAAAKMEQEPATARAQMTEP